MREEKRKYLVVVVIFIALSFLVVISLRYRRKKQPIPEGFKKPTSTLPVRGRLPLPTVSLVPSPETISEKEIIDRTIIFLQTRRLENGLYLSSIDEGEGEPLVNAYSAAGYLALYRNTGSKNFLLEAQIDLGYLLDYCEIHLKECLWVLWPISFMYDITQNESYLTYLRSGGEELRMLSSENPRILGVESKELIQICQTTGDQSYCQEGIKRMEKARNLLTSLGDTSDTCFVTLAEAEVYKLSQQELYLKKTKEFLREETLNSVSKTFNSNQYIACLDTLATLAEVDGSAQWQALFLKKMEEFISKRWDEKKGAIFFLENTPENRKRNFYMTIDSANFLRLLAFYSNLKAQL